jgi:hypothetical protein
MSFREFRERRPACGCRPKLHHFASSSAAAADCWRQTPPAIWTLLPLHQTVSVSPWVIVVVVAITPGSTISAAAGGSGSRTSRGGGSRTGRGNRGSAAARGNRSGAARGGSAAGLRAAGALAAAPDPVAAAANAIAAALDPIAAAANVIAAGVAAVTNTMAALFAAPLSAATLSRAAAARSRSTAARSHRRRSTAARSDRRRTRRSGRSTAAGSRWRTAARVTTTIPQTGFRLGVAKSANHERSSSQRHPFHYRHLLGKVVRGECVSVRLNTTRCFRSPGCMSG